MYITLKKLIDKIIKKGVNIKIENREKWKDYGFPTQHVEIINHNNKADKDLWDGLILGYKNSSHKYNTIYNTKNIIGIILVEDGNHKLLFKIPRKRGFDNKIFNKEVKKFIRNYHKETNLKTLFLNIEQLYF